MKKHPGMDPSEKSESAISRRKFIHGVAASAATGACALAIAREAGRSSSTLGAPAADGAATQRTGADHFKVLTRGDGLLLAVVLNRLIPPSDGVPGAGDLGVATFIDDVLGDAPHLRPNLIGFLSELRIRGAFTQLSEVEADELLHRMARDQKESFDILLQATYIGYYSNPHVLGALGWVRPDRMVDQPEPFPFDPRLLENVRKRGSIYRHV